MLIAALAFVYIDLDFLKNCMAKFGSHSETHTKKI